MGVDQIVQLAGALPILIAFVAAQFGRLQTDATPYLWLNLVGSSILAAVAFAGAQWGFLLLECVWAAVSAWTLAHARHA